MTKAQRKMVLIVTILVSGTKRSEHMVVRPKVRVDAIIFTQNQNWERSDQPKDSLQRVRVETA
jgi:hypothetical protein